jgi:hypothetical protein
MSALTGAQLKALVDSISAQYDILKTAIGAATTAATILYGQQSNVDRIKVYTDEDPRVDLEKLFAAEKDQMTVFGQKIDNFAIQALENHIRRTEDMSVGEYWEDENYPTYRIPFGFARLARAIGLYLAPELVYAPVTAMGGFVASGAGAGTFTDGSLIDANLYGPANLEVAITVGVAVTLTATITGTDENGAVVTGVATVSNKAVGDKVDVVPDQVGKQFQDVTNVTITGGAAANAFTVQSKVDRSLTL